jgi:hypothetical protein
LLDVVVQIAIVDFKLFSKPWGLMSISKPYVNWEDSEQGGDFDQDSVGE